MRPIILSTFRASLAAVSPQPCQRLTEASPKSHRSHAKVTEKPSTRRAANYFHTKPTALTRFPSSGFLQPVHLDFIWISLQLHFNSVLLLFLFRSSVSYSKVLNKHTPFVYSVYLCLRCLPLFTVFTVNKGKHRKQR